MIYKEPYTVNVNNLVSLNAGKPLSTIKGTDMPTKPGGPQTG